MKYGVKYAIKRKHRKWPIFCSHVNLEFVRNIHGDEINLAGGNRSWWICKDCGKYFLKPDLMEYV